MSTDTETPGAGTAAEQEAEPLMTPGSEAARAAGCQCPAWLNSYGEGVRAGCNLGAEEGTFLAHPDCPLHGSL